MDKTTMAVMAEDNKFLLSGYFRFSLHEAETASNSVAVFRFVRVNIGVEIAYIIYLLTRNSGHD
jgi:hypothetical protein